MNQSQNRKKWLFFKPRSGTAVETTLDSAWLRNIESAVLDVKDANSKALTRG